MRRNTIAIETVRFVLVLALCVAAIFLLNAVIDTLGHDSIKTVRHLLPLNGLTAITCMYLVSFISISIVAFVSGLFHWVSLHMIRSGVITYVLLDWLASVKHWMLSWKITGSFPLLSASAITGLTAVLLLLVVISLRSLHKGGRKLRERISTDLATP
jgi:hypothetical protein